MIAVVGLDHTVIPQAIRYALASFATTAILLPLAELAGGRALRMLAPEREGSIDEP
jgi:hypothetical protein